MYSLTLNKFYQALVDWLVSREAPTDNQTAGFPPNLSSTRNQHQAHKYTLEVLASNRDKLQEIINKRSEVGSQVPLNRISLICQDISTQIKHVILKHDFDYAPEKVGSYKNDPECVNEFYKFVSLTSGETHSSPIQPDHGILKKPGDEADSKKTHPDHLAFDD